MNADPLYEGREQSWVKHQILRQYLQRFAYIIGQHKDSITYVDCFSGPWQSRSEEYVDTSFAIAIHELRKAREGLRALDRNLRLRCCFIEDDKVAFEKLRDYAKSIDDIDIKTHRGKLEESVSEIVDFVRRPGRGDFPFVFIDPLGWKGFSLDVIKPLLQLNPCEVLINFMTEHIRRFIDWQNDSNQKSFAQLFGDESIGIELKGLTGLDRDDACVEKYISAVQRTGNYPFASCAVVLNPEKDRSHFHLIYLTRNQKGVQVFKEAEKKSMEEMEKARANAQQKSRISRSGRRELFQAEEIHDSSYYDSLRKRYCSRARRQLEDLLREKGTVRYDDAWVQSLRMPLVWESDLKEWIQDWKNQGFACLEGLRPRERTPKCDHGQRIVLASGQSMNRD